MILANETEKSELLKVLKEIAPKSNALGSDNAF